MRARCLLRMLALVGFALALSACNGGGDGGGAESPTPAPAEQPRVVVSDDGKLALEIPPGAVSEDVEINVTSVPRKDLPEELQVLQGSGDGYRLEPDGLEFSKPVAVSLEMDAAELQGQPESGTAAYGLVSLTSAGERELIDGLHTVARLGQRRIVVRGETSHFSWLGRTRGSLSVSLDLLPFEQTVGSTFSAQAEARNSDSTGSVKLKGILGQFVTLGEVSFIEILNGPPVPEEDELPENVFVVPFDRYLEFDEGVAASARVRCDSPGLGSYRVDVFAPSAVEVEGEERTTGLTVTIDAVVRCLE